LFPDYQNSIRCVEESNHLKPRRMSHDLAHSTGLPKPPGHNLEWSRVTPKQDTLVIGPQPKHRIMNITESFVEILCVHQLYTKTARRASRVARRNLVPDPLAGISHHQAPSALQKPCRSVTAWRTQLCRRRHSQAVATTTVFETLPPGGWLHVVRHHTSSTMLLVFGT